MANYIVKEKKRVKSEKRWNSSQRLKDPDIRVVHSKRPTVGAAYKPIGKYVDRMVKDRDAIQEILAGWYPDFHFTAAGVYYNDFNLMFYINARMRRKRDNDAGAGDCGGGHMKDGAGHRSGRNGGDEK